MNEATCALVLAAGKGTRMHARDLPKVMMPILGEPMLWYVQRALTPSFAEHVYTVVGFGADRVAEAFPESTERFVHQEEQLGTGHALVTAWPRLKAAGYRYVVVVNGDTPLLRGASVDRLVEEATARKAALAFLSVEAPEPNAFGRVLRDADGRVSAIIEAKDYDPEKHGPAPREVNAGLYFLDMQFVEPLLGWLGNTNAAREYYITDLVELAIADNNLVLAVNCGEDPTLMGINTPLELSDAEELLRAEIAHQHLNHGVRLHNPAGCRIGPRVTIKPGAQITGPCELMGETVIDQDVVVDAFCHVMESWLSQGAQVRHFSHLEKAEVGPGCVVGPYARLRPGAILEEKAKVGNFVEMKKAVLGKGSKASHLTYLGDAEIGEGVNIGAGTITCNYDGVRKHKTVIGNGAFIGSNTALVAPVTVGAGALVGAGSTITKDVAQGSLALTRAEQRQLPRRK
ncbi:Bifunctional protein glmU [Desulfovibrio sp. X2]|uniref:bifunctional UDP-N-acetylglucosamine diphosphorylase/glucosamine-1-phosphate N-acetyltransferase GlmU n=1 Tax=Desulfovibrio sp. X2 TaxID=941449 RepID=UPI000358B358|nr:bifunctional UDP-N-acetylglucosamine diphosphorylase/glucosamine-1-phosphate N-acetyltransferase GlmU [Desulfovibrio sp. X2]EPR43910.1 Bifunctional protein glmU [Desulfovibrio sp. X2]